MLLAGVQSDGFDDVGVGAPFLASLEADGAYDPLATSEDLRRRIPRQDESILRGALVLEAS
jgi:hypothetical protein